MQLTQVAAAIIRNDNGEILICQRAAGGSCAFLWEFPGGKLEADETLNHCLVRECKEELGIDIAVQDLFGETTYHYPERGIHMSFFHSKITGGSIAANVHLDVRWAKPETLNQYPLCPADVEIVKKLSSKEMVYANSEKN